MTFRFAEWPGSCHLFFMSEPDFANVIQQGIELQRKLSLLRPVAVGGTAAALHCGHRFSLDVDCVTPLLQQHFDEIAESLEQWDGNDLPAL